MTVSRNERQGHYYSRVITSTPDPRARERFPDHDYPQVIPEPEDVQPGALAPWCALAPRDRSGFSLAFVEAQLASSRRLYSLGSPPSRPEELDVVADGFATASIRRSAVLVALFEDEGETHVVLTRRSLFLRHHRGEISFPGGRCDENEDEVATALREAEEEVGLASSLVRPVGWLNPLVSFASNSAIWPVVATLGEPPELRANPTEVDRAFAVALRDLVSEGAFLEERWRRGERRPGADDDGYFPIYFYRVPGELIWGATARVLTELLCLVTGASWPQDRGRYVERS